MLQTAYYRGFEIQTYNTYCIIPIFKIATFNLSAAINYLDSLLNNYL